MRLLADNNEVMHLIAWRGEGFVFVGLTAANYWCLLEDKSIQSLQNDMTEISKVFQKTF